MSISDLVTSFTTSCWIPLSKAIIQILKTADKIVPNFQSYLTVKKYNSMKKITESTDKERYDDLIDRLIEVVASNTSFESFVTNYSEYIVELTNCMKSDAVYSSLETNFTKGAYGKMIDDFNRVLVPKKTDDDDGDDPAESLKTYVKTFSNDFGKVLEKFISEGGHLYTGSHDKTDDSVTDVANLMLDIACNNIQVFGVYSVAGESVVTLWASNKEMSKFAEITFSNFLSKIDTNTFELNPEHYTNMETLKRNLINKQWDLFEKHYTMLNNQSGIYFYKATYKHSDDYGKLDETQLRNTVNCYPNNYEDHTRVAFAVFYFRKNTEDVDMWSYWMTTKKVDDFLSKYDSDLFDWTLIDHAEFTNVISVTDLPENVQKSVLH
jgi:hypothetical protein